MSYTPLNSEVFTKAFTGAFSAIVIGGRYINSATSSVYDAATITAGKWAQAFDTAWGANAANEVVLNTVAEASYGAFDGRNSTNPNATYTTEVLAVIASINSELAYYAAQGIIPPSGTSGQSAYLAQDTWHIDPVNGNDANTGLTALTALKTHAELETRLGSGALVNGNLVYWAGPNTTLFSGSTPFRTGTLSGVIAQAAATNTAESGIDVAIADWTSVLDMRIRNTTVGARHNLWAWVAKDAGGGAGAARGDFSSPNDATTVGSFVSGDTYQIDTQIGAVYGDICPSNNAGGVFVSTNVFIHSTLPITDPINISCSLVGLTFNDFAFIPGTLNASGINVQGCVGVNSWNFVACSFPVADVILSPVSTVAFKNCGFKFVIINQGPGEADFYGGLVTDTQALGSAVYCNGGVTTLDAGFQARGTNGVFASAGFLQIIFASIFDTYSFAPFNNLGSGLIVGGSSAPQTFGGGGFCSIPDNSLFGKDNEGYGVEVFAGRSCSVGGSQYITGTTGDFILGSDATNIRAFVDATGIYSTVRVPTWALFDTTIAGGGFAGNAHNVAKSAHLVTAL